MKIWNPFPNGQQGSGFRNWEELKELLKQIGYRATLLGEESRSIIIPKSQEGWKLISITAAGRPMIGCKLR